MATVPFNNLQRRPNTADAPDPQHLLMAAATMDQMGKFDKISMPSMRDLGRFTEDDPTTKEDLLKLEEKEQEDLQEPTDANLERTEQIELHNRSPRKETKI